MTVKGQEFVNGLVPTAKPDSGLGPDEVSPFAPSNGKKVGNYVDTVEPR